MRSRANDCSTAALLLGLADEQADEADGLSIGR
jgi:hypothetical protein